MNKAQKLQAAAIIVNDMAGELSVEAPAASAKAPKAQKAVVAPELVVSEKELAVIRVISASDFADPVSGVVPNYVVAMEAGVPVNSIPGVIASLNKKAMIVASKVKGLGSVVGLSDIGKAYVKSVS